MKTARTAYLISILMVLSSCGEKAAEQSAYEIDRDYRRGPVDLRVAVSRSEITIAEHLDLLIEARADSGYVVEMPSFGEKLDQFGIVDYSTPPPKLGSDGSVTSSRVYELEPFLSGEYSIPPMTVAFRQEGDTTGHYLESDTIKVKVSSILPSDLEGLEIKDIAGPAYLPPGRLWLYILGGFVVAAVAGSLIFLRLRQRKEAVSRVIPAHEIAFMRLERLLAEGLIDRGMYIEFTERVSDVLRHYIEDRFGLRAPERTTEEFIVEAGDGLPVDDERKGMLKDFLVHCDLVKFAAFEPTSDDVKRTFEACRDFIDSTKKEEVSGEAA